MFKKYFLLPTIITTILLSITFYFFGLKAFLSVTILILMEVTLSFDNAVVNAKVLEEMSVKWQRRFINWGIWIAVFGTRVLLPILIVSIVSGKAIFEVLRLAIYNSSAYGEMLNQAHYSIGAFGGTFLLLVALRYFIDDNKEIHWIKNLEKKLKKFSSIESVEVSFALILLLLISYFVPEHSLDILVAGIFGCVSFVLVEGFTSSMGHDMGKVATTGFGTFLYLNLLDSAFSLDGVIGAFAISNDLFVIMVGLGVGAYFVRSFTLMLVEKKTLKELIYLEHGAHWALGVLGICMLLGLIIHVPEVIIGLTGLCFVFASFLSSRNI